MFKKLNCMQKKKDQKKPSADADDDIAAPNARASTANAKAPPEAPVPEKKVTPAPPKPTTATAAAASKPPIPAEPKNPAPATTKPKDPNSREPAAAPKSDSPKPPPDDKFKHKDDDDEDPFENAVPEKWYVKELRHNGSVTCASVGKQQVVKGKSIKKGMEKFKANPKKYKAMIFQANMNKASWPVKQQQYTLIHREGTVGYTPTGIDEKNGWQVVLMNEYEQFTPFPNHKLPKQYRDKYTDTVLSTFNYQKLDQPLMPGRGMGCVDAPHIKIIGDVDPSDIKQGRVGDCWLLSGISSIAEFDGAVKRLFRKTKNLHELPQDQPTMYTVTLWDLATWKEVDIEIDERLCAYKGSELLSSKPSDDGELWVCYLEKALAAHAGGWDKLVGGQCTHAWALMTGCKHQYIIQKTKKTGKYMCCAKYNPVEKQWLRHANSPQDCDICSWPVEWPGVGGGGEGEIDEDDLFQRMCEWDKVNYIVGCGTDGATNKAEADDGLVDNHAYSVIECHSGVAGTKIDLIKVRNPWGKGEIEDGEFDDDGPGWDQYPQIKAELNPVVADDGIFWVTKKEFFKFFGTVYLSASNMTQFLED